MVVGTTIKNWDDIIIDNNIAICITAVRNENIFKDCYPYNNTLNLETLLIKYSKILGSEGHGLNQIPNCTPISHFGYLLGVPV